MFGWLLRTRRCPTRTTRTCTCVRSSFLGSDAFPFQNSFNSLSLFVCFYFSLSHFLFLHVCQCQYCWVIEIKRRRVALEWKHRQMIAFRYGNEPNVLEWTQSLVVHFSSSGMSINISSVSSEIIHYSMKPTWKECRVLSGDAKNNALPWQSSVSRRRSSIDPTVIIFFSILYMLKQRTQADR